MLFCYCSLFLVVYEFETLLSIKWKSPVSFKIYMRIFVSNR